LSCERIGIDVLRLVSLILVAAEASSRRRGWQTLRTAKTTTHAHISSVVVWVIELVHCVGIEGRIKSLQRVKN
jgi:hypothetical protein